MPDTASTVTKKCFVVSPMGKAGSVVRQHADYLFSNLIKPALVPVGFEVARADNLSAAFLTPAMLEALATADLVVAILTGLNPNVFYELGIANSYGRPVVPLADSDVVIPFDVRDQYTVRHAKLPDPPSLDADECGRLKAELAFRAENAASAIRHSPFASILQAFGQRYSLRAVYQGKTWILNSFYGGLGEAERALNRDYELNEENNPEGLKAIAKLIKEAGTKFLGQCLALHQTVRVASLSETQRTDCLRLCNEMLGAGDATMLLVERIERKDLNQTDITKTRIKLTAILQTIDNCIRNTSGQELAFP